MTALDAEIRDAMSDLRGDSRRALNDNQPWDGTTALVVEGPAGVGKTFGLTEAAKAMARGFQADKTAKTIFSWDVMEIERGSADERIALLETLIFQAKQRSGQTALSQLRLCACRLCPPPQAWVEGP